MFMPQKNMYLLVFKRYVFIYNIHVHYVHSQMDVHAIGIYKML
jgi:hypothetical protein